MTVRHSLGLRNAALSAGLAAAFDGGNGRLNLYTGLQPPSADAAATGTLLATFVLPSDVCTAPGGGAVQLNAVMSVTALAAGTIGWGRFYRTGDTAPGLAAATTDRRLDVAIPGDMSCDQVAVAAGTIINLGVWLYFHAF